MKFMSFLKFSMVIATVFLCLSFGMRRAEAETYAVIVGVKDYIRISSLNFTKSDAYNFRDALIFVGVKKENIHLLTCPQKPGEPIVESKELAIKSNIEKVITDVLSQAKEGDTVIIFLAGHGLQLNGQPYFEPIDSRGGSVDLNPALMVSIGKIFTDLGQCKATHKLMFVDACRNDAKVAGVEPLQQLANPGQDITLFQGSRSGESCLETGWKDQNGQLHGYGIFSNALTEGLRGAAADKTSGDITLFSLAAYTMKRTQEDAGKLIDKDTKQPCKQTPYLQGNMTNFVLVPKDRVGIPTDEERNAAKASFKAKVTALAVAMLKGIAEKNQNAVLNPFDDTQLAGAIVDAIDKAPALANDPDREKAGRGLDEFSLYQLKDELFVDPVEAAVVATRKKWKDDKDAAIAAAANAAATEEKQRQQAITELKSLVSGAKDRDALFTALKDKVLVKKDDSGNYEFRYNDVPLSKGDLGDVYAKLNAVGKYLEADIAPEKYDALAKQVQKALKNPANAEIYCARKPDGQNQYTDAQRNAAAVQMMRDVYGDNALLQPDEDNIKKFDPPQKIKDEFAQVLTVLEGEPKDAKSTAAAIKVALTANEKLIIKEFQSDENETEYVARIFKENNNDQRALGRELGLVADNYTGYGNIDNVKKALGEKFRRERKVNPFYNALWQ